MAGSLQRFVYSVDPDSGGNSTSRVLVLDESNQRAIGNVTGPIPPGLDPIPATITRLEPRYIYWQGETQGGRVVRRKIVVLDTFNPFYQIGGELILPIQVEDVIENITGFITGSVGEKKSFAAPDGQDTGQDDNSQP